MKYWSEASSLKCIWFDWPWMAPINTQMAKHAMHYFYILLCLSKQNQNQTKNKTKKTKEVWHTSIAFVVS